MWNRKLAGLGCVVLLLVLVSMACWLTVRHVRQEPPGAAQGRMVAAIPTPATNSAQATSWHAWWPPVQRAGGAAGETLPGIEVVSRVLIGTARRPPGTNYLQGVRYVSGGAPTLWANAGLCCGWPPVPPTSWEALYTYPLAESSWRWFAGGNSATAVDGIPAGDAPALDEWEAGSPRPVTQSGVTRVAYLRTAMSAHGTPGESYRASVGYVSITGEGQEHGVWVPRPDSGQIAPWAFARDPAALWLYTVQMGPGGTVAQRQSVVLATGTLGAPERVFFEDSAIHLLSDAIYSTTDQAYYGLESEQPCDWCATVGRCASLTVWRSVAETVPVALSAGRMWRRYATIAGPAGWSIFEGHWSRVPAGYRAEPWSIFASISPPGEYANGARWEVAALAASEASWPTALRAVLGPVPELATPTPTVSPTPTPTPAPVWLGEPVRALAVPVQALTEHWTVEISGTCGLHGCRSWSGTELYLWAPLQHWRMGAGETLALCVGCDTMQGRYEHGGTWHPLAEATVVWP